MAQILRSKSFEIGGGVEGKHFWDRRSDAEWFAMKYGEPHIVRARFHDSAARAFYRWTHLDGDRRARFADERQMNDGLLDVVEIAW
jgi:hypothetical protein